MVDTAPVPTVPVVPTGTSSVDGILMAREAHLIAALRLVVREEIARVIEQPGAVSNVDLLSVADAAEQLHVGRATVREWIRAGHLPAYPVGPKGRRYLIKRVDLDAYINGSKVTSEPDVDEQANKIVARLSSRVANAAKSR